MFSEKRDVRDSAESKIDHRSPNKDEVKAERGGGSKLSVIFSIRTDRSTQTGFQGCKFTERVQRVSRLSRVYLYGVGLVVLDALPGAQRPAEAELGGRRLLLPSLRRRAISSVSRALLCGPIPLHLHLAPPIPLRILRRLLFLLFLLLLLRVGVRFPLPVLSQLGGFRGRRREAVTPLERPETSSPCRLPPESPKSTAECGLGCLFDADIWEQPRSERTQFKSERVQNAMAQRRGVDLP